MTRTALLLAALLLTGCAQHESTTTYQLTPTDIRFVNGVRFNTHTLWGLDDADMALAGREVCDVLAAGGTVDDATRALLPTRGTLRGQQDAAYFTGLAAHDYCPQYPTTKPAPKG